MSKKLQPITNPDPSNESQSYWESVLASWGLTPENGRTPRLWVNRGTDKEACLRQVKFVGSNMNLEGIEEEQFRKESGIVRPDGHGPDK